MADKKSSESRRKILKSIAASGGVALVGMSLPDSWSKPIVDNVILPAHAQTSGAVFGGAAVPVAMLDTENPSMLANALDALVPEAEATENKSREWYVCAIITGDMVDLTVAGLNYGDGEAGIIRQGIIALDGTPGVIEAIETGANCSFSDSQLVANVAIDTKRSNNDQLAVILMRKEGDPFTLLVSTTPQGCPPKPPLYDCGSRPSFK